MNEATSSIGSVTTSDRLVCTTVALPLISTGCIHLAVQGGPREKSANSICAIPRTGHHGAIIYRMRYHEYRSWVCDVDVHLLRNVRLRDC